MGNDSLAPVPEWAQTTEAREALDSAVSADMKFRPLEFNKVSEYQNFFGEWAKRDGTILAHVFPRKSGMEWETGHYSNRCKFCHAVVKDVAPGSFKTCPGCGRTGLLYVPGTAERQSTLRFRRDVKISVFKAADAAWMGTVAIDIIPELGAVAVQFQGAPDDESSCESMMSTFFEALGKAELV